MYFVIKYVFTILISFNIPNTLVKITDRLIYNNTINTSYV